MIILYSILFFLLGSTLASFLTLLGERIPRKEKITGRSHCNQCKHKLTFLETIPLFGYIINLGKCRYCKQPINISYLLSELLIGLLFTSSYLIIGLKVELIIPLLLICVLYTETISDILYQTVIDCVWLLGLIPIIIIRIIQGNILQYLFSSAILFSLLFLIAYIGKLILKKEALGGGDIKLYFFIGFVLKIWSGIISIFFACVFALVFILIKKSYRNKYIPLVPFISLAVIILYFYGDNIISWYLALFGM